MLCPATLSEDVLSVAVPLAKVVTTPKVLLPSLNVTLSPAAGRPVPGAGTVIVAVSATDWPNTDGVSDEETVTTVAAFAGCAHCKRRVSAAAAVDIVARRVGGSDRVRSCADFVSSDGRGAG